ncbi:MAG TPA: hypothetical protein ENI22_00260 [Candidatus Pacearchaeota archaeon]|nr:hypothetical protein [Candidatus Pacearchaeota archaeon]
MINSKEISTFLLITFILAVTVSFIRNVNLFLYTLLAIFVLILINIIAKKIAAFYLESEIEVGLWEIKRYGFKKARHFKRPFPAGIFLPIIVSVFSLGSLVWLASLVFDVKPKVYRAAKRHGLYSFSEMTEYHIGLIATAGVVANLAFAILGYFLGFPEFARLSIFFAFFNMIPISDLDGNKIFFGSLVTWSFLAAITLVGMGYALFLI